MFSSALTSLVLVAWAAGLLAGSLALGLQSSRVIADRIHQPHLVETAGVQAVQSFVSLGGQLLVGDSTTNGRDHKTIEPLEGVKLHIAVIEPERKFIHVTAKMLFAGVMIDASNAAFQQSPDALYRVRVSHST